MIKDIIQYPHPTLHKRSEAIRKVTKELVELGKDLIDTMKAANGLGLSAVQIGDLRRVLVMKRGNKTLLMYNPIIVQQSATKRGTVEGCLSFTIANIKCMVKRPTWVKVKYIDQTNTIKFVNLEDLDATVFFHELDHLNGKTFVDHDDKVVINLAVIA